MLGLRHGSACRMLRAVAWLFLFLAGLGGTSVAEPQDQAIFVVPQNNAYVYVNLIIPYEASRPGLAHYVEHLVYLTAINARFGETDPDTNAFTYGNAIAYQLSGRARELQAMLQVLAGVFRPLDLTPGAAAEERGIVMREYDLDWATDLREQAVEALTAFLFAGNGEALSSMGTAEEIAGLTLEEAQRFHAETHIPGKAILLISGDVTDETAKTALADAAFPALSARSELEPARIHMAPPAEWHASFPDAKTVPALYWNKLVTLPEPISFDRLDGLCARLNAILKSGLPGGIGKPLYYDGMQARELSVEVSAVDESHVGIWIIAEPDDHVSFAAMRTAIEAALAVSAQGIPQASFARVSKRMIVPEPDVPAAADPGWSAPYINRRLLVQRLPLDTGALREIDRQISLAEVDHLMKVIATGPGRIAIAEVGEDKGR